MTKKRSKVLIISALIALVMIALAITAVFAYSVIVDYNYDFTVYDSALEIRMEGNLLCVDRTDGELKATKADIILISTAEDLKLGTSEAKYSIEFKNGDQTYYTHVFKDMPLASNSSEFVPNKAISAVVKAAVSEAEYTEESTINKITYQNEYVSSFLQLKLLNFQSNYNNIFELAGNYYGKVVYSRTVFIIGDFAITEDLSINHPCSINILNNNLLLSADLTLHHSYAGKYYFERETIAGFGSGTISGTGKFSIKTPKAYYSVNPILKTEIGSRLTEIYDFAAYSTTLLSDALKFAKELIPARTFSDIILQPEYQTFGVDYSFYIVNTDSSETPFTGGISTVARDGSILRTAISKTHKIRIYASKGETTVHGDVNVQVVGTETESILNYIFDAFSDAYLSSKNQIFSSIDLLPIFREVYGVGGYTEDITISVSETLLPNATDLNAFKLILNDGEALGKVKIIAADITADEPVIIKNFVLQRGAVPISYDLVLKLESGTEAMSKTFLIEVPTKMETIYFLKSEADTFTTNKLYGIYNIGNPDNENGINTEAGVYEGEKKLTVSQLGLKNIEYEIVIVEDDDIEIVPTSDYFQITESGLGLKLYLDLTFIPDNLFLMYTCTFLDETIDYIFLPIVLSLADEGGDSQQFESSNPFDPLFMSTDTNWLEGGIFEVPKTAEINYAFIEILSIDGVPYNPANPYNMCYIENYTGEVGETNTDKYYLGSIVHNKTFYKKINIITDLRYVPDKNSSVKFKCYYWVSTADEISITQEYTITIKGIFKCGDGAQQPGDTPYIFSDRDFYDMTIELIEIFYPETKDFYVSTIDGEKILLSDSTYAKPKLDYSRFASGYTGDGIDTKGIERLANVPTIIMDGIKIANLSPLELMVGSALKTLSLANCRLADTALYANGATQSYIYEIQLNNVILRENALSRTDKLLSRTVTTLDISMQENNAGQKTLTDITGLDSIKNLVTLDVSSNAIYRFEILKGFNFLKKVYLYNNRVDGTKFTVYGTDGYTNIPHYVWIIKTNSVRIFANANNLSEATASMGYLIFGASSALFSKGGNIIRSMQEGSVALNAFASSTQIFDANGKAQIEYDYENLLVEVIGEYSDEAEGGVDNEEVLVTSYCFRFYDIANGGISTSFVFMQDYQKVTALINGSFTSPVQCSYILSIMKTGDDGEPIIGDDGKPIIIAMREFLVDVYYNV